MIYKVHQVFTSNGCTKEGVWSSVEILVPLAEAIQDPLARNYSDLTVTWQ